MRSAEGLVLPPRRVTLALLPYLSIGTILNTPQGASEIIRRYGGGA